jgi:hypothetical protein
VTHVHGRSAGIVRVQVDDPICPDLHVLGTGGELSGYPDGIRLFQVLDRIVANVAPQIVEELIYSR